MERFFKKNGYAVKLTRDMNEPLEHFIERGEFVVSQRPANKDEYDYAVGVSRIYRNNKYNNASYDDKLITDMGIMINKMFEE